MFAEEKTAIRENTAKPQRDQIPDGDVLCEYCTAKCCRYFALPIEIPHTRSDFDFIRWYLLHNQATVFIDEGDWYILVHTECRHLQTDNRCGIYDTRPEICRQYSTGNCEYDDSWTYDGYFETPEQIEEYVDALLLPVGRQGIRSDQPPLLPIVQ